MFMSPNNKIFLFSLVSLSNIPSNSETKAAYEEDGDLYMDATIVERLLAVMTVLSNSSQTDSTLAQENDMSWRR